MSKNEDRQVSCNVSALDVARYFTARDLGEYEPSMTPLKLQKLMYLSQANYLASTGCRLFDEATLAFKLGPVFETVRSHYQGSEVIALNSDPHPAVDEIDLPIDVKEFLNEVWTRFGRLTASALVDLSHRHDPWRDNYVEDAYRIVIPDEEMAEYFRQKAPTSERILHRGIAIVFSRMVDEFDDDAAVEEFFSHSRS